MKLIVQLESRKITPFILNNIIKTLQARPDLTYQQIATACESTRAVVKAIAGKRTWKKETEGIIFPPRERQH